MPAERNRSQREDAYQTYRSIQGKRSLRLTAELTGIPMGTILDWSRHDGWVLRLKDDDDRDRALIRRHAEMRLVAEHDILIDRLLHLSASGKPEHKIQFEATKHALGLLGQVPAQPTPYTTPHHDTPSLPPNIRTLSDQELASLEHGHTTPHTHHDK